MAESKLNSIADRISAALNDDKMSDEEFRLILFEIDKYDQIKAEVRGRQKQGLSEDEKKELVRQASDEAMKTVCSKLLKELLYQAVNNGTSQ